MFTRGIAMLALPRGSLVCRRTIKARHSKVCSPHAHRRLGECLVVWLFVCINAHLVLQLEKLDRKSVV